jgi:lactoylglutathione lyase
MKIEHVAIWARDLESLREFYEKYFEARASEKYRNEKKQFESYFLEFGFGARLELMHRTDVGPAPAGERHGYAHLAMSVGSEAAVEELTTRLERDGYTRLDGPRWTGDGCYESVVLDPEANRIELTV